MITPTKGRSSKTSGSKGKPVVQYTMDGKRVTTYSSSTEAGEKTGANPRMISQCVNNKSAYAGGYRWSYVGSSPCEIKERAKPQKKYGMTVEEVASELGMSPYRVRAIVDRFKENARRNIIMRSIAEEFGICPGGEIGKHARSRA